MKKLIALLATSFLLVASYVNPSAKLSLLDSVRPLIVVHEGHNLPACTTGLIDSKKHYWITANHCIKDEPLKSYNIDGKPVELIKNDEKVDLTVLKADVGGVELRVGDKAPDFLDPVTIVSYTGGATFPIAVSGRVAHPGIVIPEVDDQKYLLMNIFSAGGTSGSPIVDGNGRIVSIAVKNFFSILPGAPSDITGGVDYNDLRDFLKGL